MTKKVDEKELVEDKSTDKVVEEVKEEKPKEKPKPKKTTTKRKTTTTRRKANVKDLQKVDVEEDSKTSTKTKNEKGGKNSSKKEVVEEEKVKTPEEVLPKDYFPKFTKHGLNSGYLSIPHRIYRWIELNPEDWYLKIEEHPYFGDDDFFYSIIYYIIKDGFVNIQNLQTNKFYKLKID